MKIRVNRTFDESITGEGRCSDGHYRESSYKQSVKIFSDSEHIYLTSAEKICNYINEHTESGKDQVWEWSYVGETTETYDSQLTEKLILLLENEIVEAAEKPEECTILLNPIASKILDSHKSYISELSNKQLVIKDKYLKESLDCKIEIATKAFCHNNNIYHYNEIIPGFEEFPLDIALHNDDVEFLDLLISNGATSVKDPYVFVKWLCKRGKFEYLDLFVDLSKLQLIRGGSSPDVNQIKNDWEAYLKSLSENQIKNEWLAECILYYTIAHNRLDLFKKFGKDRLGKDISEIRAGADL